MLALLPGCTIIKTYHEIQLNHDITIEFITPINIDIRDNNKTISIHTNEKE